MPLTAVGCRDRGGYAPRSFLATRPGASRLARQHILCDALDDAGRQRGVGGGYARVVRAQHIGERPGHRLHGREHLTSDRGEDRRRHGIDRHSDHHAALRLVERSEAADRSWHRRVVAVLLIRRIDDRRRRHDPDFETRDSSAGKAQPLGRGARDVELALMPIGTGVVHADDGRVAVLRIANEENCPVRVDRTGGGIGFIGTKGFA